MVRVALLASLSALCVDASGRGVGDGKVQTVEDTKLLKSLPWWYSWTLNPRFDEDFSQEFVAMVWGKKSADALSDWKPHHSTKYLLGFNEPNMGHQSNMSAKEACAQWPTLVKEAKARGFQLGSPAANHCNPEHDNCSAFPMDWFDEFFAQQGCDLSTVDFIATHKYGCNATDTVEYVKQLHKRYNKPIWLTEFACGPDTPPEKQLAFMKEILPKFDAMPEILPRYAWFVAKADHTENRVLIKDGALTGLGQYYTASLTEPVEV